MPLETSYRQRRLAERLADTDFRDSYYQASSEIAQVDAVMRALDNLRLEAGISKAELARQIDKNPASVRRLFTSEVNPELKTVAALADALGAEIVIKKRRRRRASAPASVAVERL